MVDDGNAITEDNTTQKRKPYLPWFRRIGVQGKGRLCKKPFPLMSFFSLFSWTSKKREIN